MMATSDRADKAADDLLSELFTEIYDAGRWFSKTGVRSSDFDEFIDDFKEVTSLHIQALLDERADTQL